MAAIRSFRYRWDMEGSRTALLRLASVLVLGLAACKPEEQGAASAGFDPTATANRVESPRFGKNVETVSPAAAKLMAAGKGAGAGKGGPTSEVSDSGRWKQVFDGAGLSPLGEDAPDPTRIGALMAGEGVRQDIVNTVLDESQRQGADPLLVFAVMKQESSFDPRAHSPAGARGLMQVMPDTGRGLDVHDPAALFDPRVNVRAGVRYLKGLFSTFSDVAMTQLSLINPLSDSGVKSAIAAYNAGPGAVQKYGGVPPYSETQGYVSKVLHYYQAYRNQLDAI